MIVQVKFKKVKEEGFETKIYSFLCNLPDVKVGDYAVADTRYGPSLCKITKINVWLKENADIRPSKYIIVVIDKKLFGENDRDEIRERKDTALFAYQYWRGKFMRGCNIDCDCLACRESAVVFGMEAK